MRRLAQLQGRRVIIADLRDELRVANGNLWRAANREFDLKCENKILKDMLAASVGDTRVAS